MLEVGGTGDGGSGQERAPSRQERAPSRQERASWQAAGLRKPSSARAELASVNELKDFLERQEGSCLRAWLQHFDRQNCQRLTQSAFSQGLMSMGYAGDGFQVFNFLDSDRSGELTLDEVHPEQASLWRRFRAFCSACFEDAEDMLRKLCNSAPSTGRARASRARRIGSLVEAEFCEGICRCGWGDGHEALIFGAVRERDGAGELRGVEPGGLRWLDIEKQRQRRKAQMKQLAQQERRRCTGGIQANVMALEEFRRVLKRRYGSFVRAWRSVLSRDDSMVLQCPQFLKSCASMGWGSEAKKLWKALDKDDSESVTIDELDPQSARTLIEFRAWVDQTFGSAASAFRALDKDGTLSVSQEEFRKALCRLGFKSKNMKTLFHGLDKDGTRHLTLDSIRFLDSWKPLPFWLASPNPDAVEALKQRLEDRFGNFLKAWRQCLDRDSTNRCNWSEFQAACTKVSFQGDVPGAWRALDEDFSGFITLREFDRHSNDILLAFRAWADEEFGGVKSAFRVFDEDRSNKVSGKEFRQSCCVYGFHGPVAELFRALDVERSRTLTIENVAFLDDWDCPTNPQKATEVSEPAATMQKRAPKFVERKSVHEPEPAPSAQAAATYRSTDIFAAAGLAVPPSLCLLERASTASRPSPRCAGGARGCSARPLPPLKVQRVHRQHDSKEASVTQASCGGVHGASSSRECPDDGQAGSVPQTAMSCGAHDEFGWRGASAGGAEQPATSSSMQDEFGWRGASAGGARQPATARGARDERGLRGASAGGAWRPSTTCAAREDESGWRGATAGGLRKPATARSTQDESGWRGATAGGLRKPATARSTQSLASVHDEFGRRGASASAHEQAGAAVAPVRTDPASKYGGGHSSGRQKHAGTRSGVGARAFDAPSVGLMPTLDELLEGTFADGRALSSEFSSGAKRRARAGDSWKILPRLPHLEDMGGCDYPLTAR